MVLKSRAYEEQRVRRIRQKYGANAFERWGKLGGNPACLAQGRGDKIIIRKRKSR